MNTIPISDILELPVEVTAELKIEFEARLKEFEANPEAGYSWDEVKLRLKDGSWRTA